MLRYNCYCTSTTSSGRSFHIATGLCKYLSFWFLLNVSPPSLNLYPLFHEYPTLGKTAFTLSMSLMILYTFINSPFTPRKNVTACPISAYSSSSRVLATSSLIFSAPIQLNGISAITEQPKLNTNTPSVSSLMSCTTVTQHPIFYTHGPPMKGNVKCFSFHRCCLICRVFLAFFLFQISSICRFLFFFALHIIHMYATCLKDQWSILPAVASKQHVLFSTNEIKFPYTSLFHNA